MTLLRCIADIFNGRSRLSRVRTAWRTGRYPWGPLRFQSDFAGYPIDRWWSGQQLIQTPNGIRAIEIRGRILMLREMP
jgi:hypothetical protein